MLRVYPKLFITKTQLFKGWGYFIHQLVIHTPRPSSVIKPGLPKYVQVGVSQDLYRYIKKKKKNSDHSHFIYLNNICIKNNLILNAKINVQRNHRFTYVRHYSSSNEWGLVIKINCRDLCR